MGVKKGDMPRGHAMPGWHHDHTAHGADTESEFERNYDAGEDPLDHPTDVKEVWFGGAHTGMYSI